MVTSHARPPLQSVSITPVRPVRRGVRVFFFFSLAFLITGVVSLLFADLLWRTGWSSCSTLLLALFVVLFFLAAIGCVHGAFGFFLRQFGNDRRITRLNEFASRDIKGASTAIIVPIYNEDVVRVYEGLRASYLSLQQTGHLDNFDFFILSDSTDPDKWIEEERRWAELVQQLNALGRIYYRRRYSNEGKKSGNVRDFLSNWGRRYRYFVVFDADSIMRGTTIVTLVKLMESNPSVGLIQTVPALVNAESLFGRMQQFANRLYAPIFISGLNYWAQSFGNYWGHNAIIRTEPFMQYCDLPFLPGRKPFGGQILSHDFVEAALLLKENWQVWLATDLEGSYEEGPQGLIENAQRDRRWCQGNLQHGMVVFARGLRGLSRIHLAMGIFGYLSSPLWLMFLLTFNWILQYKKDSGLSDITVQSFTPFIRLTGTQHAFLIFLICMTVLFIPKLLALIDLARDKKRCQAFGGFFRAALGAFMETLFSTLHAPLQMLWHSKFVATILIGMGVNWGTQNRGADGTPWPVAVRQHWGHTLLGLVWGAFVWQLDQTTFWWFAPVLAGMVCSIPLSVITSRGTLGLKARSLGLFLVPEETNPPPELVSTRMAMAQSEEKDSKPQHSNTGLAEAVLDPYVNATHVSLLRESLFNPAYAELLNRLETMGGGVQKLGERLLAQGPDALTSPEKLRVLSSANTMSWIHRQVWLGRPEQLAPWWRAEIRRYAR